MKNVFLTLAIVLFTLSAAAMPARHGARQITQPDGSTITVYAHGDEHCHWLTNEQGEWVEHGEDGYYRVTERLTEKQIQEKRRNSPYRTPEEAQTAIRLNIAPRGLVIMAEFQDVKFSVSRAVIDTMLRGYNFTREYDYTYNKEDYHVSSYGSARQYFEQSSFGQYSPQFDLVGPVTLSQNMSYYGSNSAGRDANVQQMIKEACELAAKAGADFSLYDNDNNGKVDFVYIIYAGYGEADGGPAETVWPHKSVLRKYTLKLNGKQIYDYACGNEMNFYSKRYFGIGQFVHEFGHVLGLPDIYETTGNAVYKTCGMWDIMDYGPYNNDGNTPPAYTAYERFFCGWLTPRQLSEPENVTLRSLTSYNEALIISPAGTHNLKGNDPFPLSFYMLENRQPEWWDSSLPGHGMTITKIQYNYSTWTSNVVNNTENGLGIDIIEADGTAPKYPDTGWYGKAGDAFPAGATFYKAIIDNAITDIKETDGVITFKYRGGSVSSIISSTETDSKQEKKVVKEGNIYIIREGQTYDILGRKTQIRL